MNKQERQRRLAICRKCEHHLDSKIVMVSVERCNQCGCVLQMLLIAGCPVKKF